MRQLLAGSEYKVTLEKALQYSELRHFKRKACQETMDKHILVGALLVPGSLRNTPAFKNLVDYLFAPFSVEDFRDNLPTFESVFCSETNSSHNNNNNNHNDGNEDDDPYGFRNFPQIWHGLLYRLLAFCTGNAFPGGDAYGAMSGGVRSETVVTVEPTADAVRQGFDGAVFAAAAAADNINDDDDDDDDGADMDEIAWLENLQAEIREQAVFEEEDDEEEDIQDGNGENSNVENGDSIESSVDNLHDNNSRDNDDDDDDDDSSYQLPPPLNQVQADLKRILKVIFESSERSRALHFQSSWKSSFVTIDGKALFQYWKSMLQFIVSLSGSILAKLAHDHTLECPRLISLAINILVDQFIIGVLTPTLRSPRDFPAVSPMGFRLGIFEHMEKYGFPFNLSMAANDVSEVI